MLTHHMRQRDVNAKQDLNWSLVFFIYTRKFVWKLPNYFFDVLLECNVCMHIVYLCVNTCLLELRVSLWLYTLKFQTAVIQEVAVWLSRACPHSEKFEAPEAWAPFSPTAAPELCLTLHTKWRLCVTNWFQLAVAMVSTLEGAVGGRRGGGCVTWPQRNAWCHVTCLVEQ